MTSIPSASAPGCGVSFGKVSKMGFYWFLTIKKGVETTTVETSVRMFAILPTLFVLIPKVAIIFWIILHRDLDRRVKFILWHVRILCVGSCERVMGGGKLWFEE